MPMAESAASPCSTVLRADEPRVDRVVEPNLAGRVKAAALQIGSGASTAAKSVATKGVDTAVAFAPQSLLDAQSKIVDRLDATQTRLKRQLEVYVKAKVQRQIITSIERLPGLAKELLEDPDMPRCVSGAKDRIVDAMWPDVREEILWEVAWQLDSYSIMPKNAPLEHGNENPQQAKTNCLLAFLRYHLFPNDKSFWGTLRDPWWLLYNALSILPHAAVVPATFVFQFLVIDKSDEFQLVDFILRLKGLQFFSQGIMRCAIGYYLYFMCVTAPGDEREHICEHHGPGLMGSYPTVIAAWLIQLLLMWTAYFFLRCSDKKGRKLLHSDIHEDVGIERPRGGHLFRFMVYDLACFILCLIIFLSALISSKNNFDHWTLKHTLYACQILSGYLAVPFFLLKLPLLDRALTHATKTAYDSQGRCCHPAPSRKSCSHGSDAGERCDRQSAEMNSDATPCGGKAVAPGVTGEAALCSSSHDGVCRDDGAETLQMSTSRALVSKSDVVRLFADFRAALRGDPEPLVGAEWDSTPSEREEEQLEEEEEKETIRIPEDIGKAVDGDGDDGRSPVQSPSRGGVGSGDVSSLRDLTAVANVGDGLCDLQQPLGAGGDADSTVESKRAAAATAHPTQVCSTGRMMRWYRNVVPSKAVSTE
eukprot:TRINITY_DN17637_c0_g2_i1.p1 TRINITY_DN17637_c0_g2~~TRINITY_DN17637_c0_g2_i1.p1  ORF type:complete len:648 (-),score=95.69 TRINITY_DN17637_c0_g2_i1:115-2058(-)